MHLREMHFLTSLSSKSSIARLITEGIFAGLENRYAGMGTADSEVAEIFDGSVCSSLRSLTIIHDSKPRVVTMASDSVLGKCNTRYLYIVANCWNSHVRQHTSQSNPLRRPHCIALAPCSLPPSLAPDQCYRSYLSTHHKFSMSLSISSS